MGVAGWPVQPVITLWIDAYIWQEQTQAGWVCADAPLLWLWLLRLLAHSTYPLLMPGVITPHTTTTALNLHITTAVG